MFRLFNSPREEELYNGEQLKQRDDNDGYRRKKWILNTLAFIVCVLIALFAVALVWEYQVDMAFREAIVSQFESHFGEIVVGLLVIFGIKFTQG